MVGCGGEGACDCSVGDSALGIHGSFLSREHQALRVDGLDAPSACRRIRRWRGLLQACVDVTHLAALHYRPRPHNPVIGAEFYDTHRIYCDAAFAAPHVSTDDRFRGPTSPSWRWSPPNPLPAAT